MNTVSGKRGLNELGQLQIIERLAGNIHAVSLDASFARFCQPLDCFQDDPAVKLSHHPEVLEHGQEIAWRQKRLLLLPESYQNFRDWKCLRGALQRKNWLAENLELVLV